VGGRPCSAEFACRARQRLLGRRLLLGRASTLSGSWIPASRSRTSFAIETSNTSQMRGSVVEVRRQRHL
jgi:hypothetical protein